jgi:RHS repeat-associated protein
MNRAPTFMLRVLFSGLGLFWSFRKAHTQVIPNGSGVPTVSDVPALPQANLGGRINYVRTWELWKPVTDASQVSQQSVADAKVTTAYIDGQGRVVQTVSKQISPAGKDMVAYKQFDLWGRESVQPLSYTSTETNGDFKADPYGGQQYYYSTGSVNNNQYGGEQIYFGRTSFELSPLGRPDTVMAPGNSWAGSNRGVRYFYQVNTISDSVRNWTIADAAGSTPSTSTTYNEGELYKTIIIDEDGKQTIEYKDKQGTVVLKKVQDADSPGTAHMGWLCTYYIYDDYGSLRVVIQPQAIAALLYAGNWSVSTLMDELCFRYEYDQRNRMIIKKVPGAGEVYMVYDARDRVVLTQDANLRNGSPAKWLLTGYDHINRVVYSGLINSSSSRATHQSSAYSSTAYPNLANYSGNYDEHSTTTYDKYYSYQFDNQDVSKLTAGNNAWPESVEATEELVYGKMVESITNVLSAETGLEPEHKSVYYDTKGRIVQVLSDHVELNHDHVTNRYDFSGKLICSYERHTFDGASSHNLVTIRTRMEFDNAGRTTRLWKQVNDANEKQIVENSYDELGQLKSKKLEPTYNSYAGLETLNYEYNIRGWLKSINKDYTNGTNNLSWFGQTLSYNHGFTAQQYNGNISGWQWRSKGDGERRAYGFTYDNLNRLLIADFTQHKTSSWNTSAGIDYTVNNLAYDANGNIRSMKQYGWKLGGSTMIDKLNYTYVNSGSSNKLLKVIDDITTDNKLGDFYDGTNGSNNDYTYDDNGNLITDNNKGISSIEYNHLNLPQTITVAGKGSILYGYSSNGEKLLKKVTDDPTSTSSITTYYNGFVFKDYELQFIPHEEGRIRPKDTSFVYDYFIKDHLGNVRMVLTDEEQTDAYPAATMENDASGTEETFYSNLPSTRADLPRDYPEIEGNRKVAKLIGHSSEVTGPNSGNGDVQIGPAILLKVMSGDKFNLTVNSWWTNVERGPEEPTDPVNELIHDISNSFGSVSGNHPTSTELEGSEELSGSITGFFGDQTYDDTKPKAFVNWLLLDERFNYVSSSSGFEQVGDEEDYTTHTFNDMPIEKNGYLYIFVSNATLNIDVYFDNLQVTHVRGPLVEESSYYPFGLIQKGISSNALGFGGPKNKEKTFQGQKFDDELDLDWVQFKWRNHDPQIGRFIEIDPLSDKYVYNSTYAFSENKVIAHVELEGLECASASGPMGYVYSGFGQMTDFTAKTIDNVTNISVTFGSAFTFFKSQKGSSTSSLVLTTESTINLGTNLYKFVQNSKAPEQYQNNVSLFTASRENTVTTEYQEEVKTNQGTVTFKTALDFSKVGVEASKQTVVNGVPLFLEGSSSYNFDTKTKSTSAKVGIGFEKANAYGKVERKTSPTTSSTTISIGAESRTGNVKSWFSINKTITD